MGRRIPGQRAWEAFEREEFRHQRPTIPAIAADPDPTSWQSRCSGWAGQYHEQLRIEGAQWRCRHCAQLFNPPIAER